MLYNGIIGKGRYPALYKTAFKSGYSIIHPNCRHSWSPYHMELYSEEERRQALERSNRTWKPDGDGRVFQQTERARAEYSKGQQLMRQWNAEIVEYERMKAYYAEQGQEPPYKSLGAFRREVRKPHEKQSPAMRSWKRQYGDQLQYERWKAIVGIENMPKTLAKFQQIKYNKSSQLEFELLRHYKYAREEGDVSALVGFKLYKKGKQSLESRFIGQTTITGTKVKSISNHFVDRYFGTIYRKSLRVPKHEGVSIREIEEVFYKGDFCEIKIDKKGRKSQKIYIKGVCDLTINPETGELIQCNKISE